jgi:hypothetical protein
LPGLGHHSLPVSGSHPSPVSVFQPLPGLGHHPLPVSSHHPLPVSGNHPLPVSTHRTLPGLGHHPLPVSGTVSSLGYNSQVSEANPRIGTHPFPILDPGSTLNYNSQVSEANSIIGNVSVNTPGSGINSALPSNSRDLPLTETNPLRVSNPVSEGILTNPCGINGKHVDLYCYKPNGINQPKLRDIADILGKTPFGYDTVKYRLSVKLRYLTEEDIHMINGYLYHNDRILYDRIFKGILKPRYSEVIINRKLLEGLRYSS